MPPPDLKLVPKPEGFELRDKRSDKSCRADQWTIQDALYDVSREVAKPDSNCDAVLIIFRKRSSEGAPITCFRYSGKEGQAASLLLNGMAKLMDWRPGDTD